MTVHKALTQRDYIDSLYEKKDNDDPPALKITWMYQYEDSNTSSKRAKKEEL